MAACDLWPDERFIKDRIFDESKSGAELNVTVLDLPKLHNPNEPVAQQMIEALANVEDTSIYQCRSVQSMIAFRWVPCKRYVLRRQMMPYCGFFIAYLIYVFYILDLDEEYRMTHEEHEIPKTFLVFESFWNILLVIWSLFFLAAERRQL